VLNSLIDSSQISKNLWLFSSQNLEKAPPGIVPIE